MSESLYTLEKGELLAIERGRASEVRVRCGRIWLTQHKDEKDYLLEAGEALPLNGRGTTVIKAYGRTMIELLDSRPSSAKAGAADVRTAGALPPKRRQIALSGIFR